MVPLVAHSPAAVEALALPREDWSNHPRFASQALLLGSHRNFRQISRVLVRRASSASDSPAIYHVFKGWKAAMHSHERYEEAKLYPFLATRWGLSFADAAAGHAALSEAEAAVLKEAGRRGDATPALAEALRHHDDVLRAHLALEEDLVLPALLALTPAEFARYTRG